MLWLSTINLSLIPACLSIAANALCAGGIFMFPQISPALASRLKLTQPQLTTIVLAGIMSSYPLAAVTGKIIDRHGPAVCSLIASIMFTFAFGAFGLEVMNSPEVVLQPSTAVFHRLTFYYLIAGLGMVFSYFSSLFAASKRFQNHMGIASGTSMGLFGLSPLFYSVIASNWFTDSDSGLLDVPNFMFFLAALTCVVNTIGAFTLKGMVNLPDSDQSNSQNSSPQGNGVIDETTSLLPSNQSTCTPFRKQDRSFLYLLGDKNFWLLAIFCLLTLGTSEMVISNIASIVLSLPPGPSAPHTGNMISSSSTSQQVQLLSISNTLSKILVGPMADFVSPVASYSPSGLPIFATKRRISRIIFLSGPAILLFATFLWMESAVVTQGDIWVLSFGTGLGYGAVFTALPSIISSIWGMDDLGRNFGALMFAPFTGTPIFSYLYAFVANSHTSNGPICEGRICWQLTFLVSVGASLFALLISLVLWRNLRGRI